MTTRSRSRRRPDAARTQHRNRAWRRRNSGEAHGGGHGWFVTFADLMGLLVAFFVMLVAFSTQDKKKLQIVAGSMREAFGVQNAIRYSGIIEVDGLPTRPQLKNADKHQAGGRLGDAEPGREEPQPQFRRAARQRRRLCAGLGLAASGAAGHAGDRRAVEARHDRGDQAGPQYRDHRSERPLDVSGGLPRSPTSAPAGWCSGWRLR